MTGVKVYGYLCLFCCDKTLCLCQLTKEFPLTLDSREVQDHHESDIATGVRHDSYSRRQRSHILSLQHEAESGKRK